MRHVFAKIRNMPDHSPVRLPLSERRNAQTYLGYFFAISAPPFPFCSNDCLDYRDGRWISQIMIFLGIIKKINNFSCAENQGQQRREVPKQKEELHRMYLFHQGMKGLKGPRQPWKVKHSLVNILVISMTGDSAILESTGPHHLAEPKAAQTCPVSRGDYADTHIAPRIGQSGAKFIGSPSHRRTKRAREGLSGIRARRTAYNSNLNFI